MQRIACGPVEIVHWTNIIASFPEDLWEKSKKSRSNNEELGLDLNANENVHGIRNRNDCVRFECHKTTIRFKTLLKFVWEHTIAHTSTSRRASSLRADLWHAWFNSRINETRFKPLIMVGSLCNLGLTNWTKFKEGMWNKIKCKNEIRNGFELH